MKRQRFLKAKRPKLPGLGAAGAVALMAMAGLSPLTGGKVVWSPPHNTVVWASPNSEQLIPDWVRLFPIPLVTTVFKVTGDTSFADPGTWNDTNNLVEIIGHGGNGSPGSAVNRGGPGGGSACYAFRANIPVLANGDFPIAVAVFAGGSGSGINSTFNASHVARSVAARGGNNATTTTPGAGGTGFVGDGNNVGRAGGARPTAGIIPGAGGGGAGGPNGSGVAGGAASATTSGAGGDADGSVVLGPAGTTLDGPGANGNSGTEWTSKGCGTGGAGGGIASGDAGGNGGNYGGGGGGGGGLGSGGIGGDGLIIISWGPSIIPPPVTTPAPESAGGGSTQYGRRRQRLKDQPQPQQTYNPRYEPPAPVKAQLKDLAETAAVEKVAEVKETTEPRPVVKKMSFRPSGPTWADMERARAELVRLKQDLIAQQDEDDVELLLLSIH